MAKSQELNDLMVTTKGQKNYADKDEKTGYQSHDFDDELEKLRNKKAKLISDMNETRFHLKQILPDDCPE